MPNERPTTRRWRHALAIGAPLPEPMAEVGRGAGHWLASWWRVVHLGAMLLALAIAPSSWRGTQRRRLSHAMVRATTPVLLPFGILVTLVNVVLIRIVVVTAVSYGLTQYALEMVVRVLVLELIPLTAALFASLRCTIPNAMEVAALRVGDTWQDRSRAARSLREEVMPRVAAGMFCTLLLAALSCVIALVAAYLSIYGATLSGFAGYTRTVGQVFDPAISMVFALKIVFFSFAVALLPMASVLDDALRRRSRTSAELHGLVRMFLVLLIVEAASLVGDYY